MHQAESENGEEVDNKKGSNIKSWLIGGAAVIGILAGGFLIATGVGAIHGLAIAGISTSALIGIGSGVAAVGGLTLAGTCTANASSTVYKGTPPDKGKEHELNGLTNFGCNCYQNATLQMLPALGKETVIQSLSQDLPQDWDDEQDVEYNEGRMKVWEKEQKNQFRANARDEITKWLSGRVETTTDCHVLRGAIHDGLGSGAFPQTVHGYTHKQQDGSEFLVTMLDRMNYPQTKYASTCVKSQDLGVNTETTFDSAGSFEMSINGCSRLSDVVNAHFGVEEVPDEVARATHFNSDNEDLGKCTGMTKKLTLASHPEHLVLTLKRYEFDHANETYSSDKHAVELDDFSLEDINGVEKTYSPSAIMCHKGSSPEKGHYYTYRKDEEGIWWKFDDRKVTKIDTPELKRKMQEDVVSNAYSLVNDRL